MEGEENDAFKLTRVHEPLCFRENQGVVSSDPKSGLQTPKRSFQMFRLFRASLLVLQAGHTAWHCWQGGHNSTDTLCTIVGLVGNFP